MPELNSSSVVNPLTANINLATSLSTKPGSPVKHYKLYALKLQDNKYYVGMTAKMNPYNRINAHGDFFGARWTMLHKPTDLLEIRDLGLVTKEIAEDLENKLTLIYMKIYGYKNVRGGQTTYSGRIFKFGKWYLRSNWLWDLATALVLFALTFYVLFHRH